MKSRKTIKKRQHMTKEGHTVRFNPSIWNEVEKIACRKGVPISFAVEKAVIGFYNLEQQN